MKPEIEVIRLKIIEAKKKKATELSINGYNISFIPEEIGELEHLRNLNLNANKLVELPKSLKNLQNLITLEIANNNIKELPKELASISTLKYIDCSNNPISFPPPEILNKDINTIKNYLSSFVEEEENILLNEAKLIIVGNGGVGKTCLLHMLVYKKIKSDVYSTEGIEVNKWNFVTSNDDKFTANFWDFGGQEIYHATHQFFLTKRSLYLLVWEARKDDDITSFDYWLNVISLLSNKSPIIIIQNKTDERLKTIDQTGIKENFPNVIDFYNVSALKGVGIEDLREKIKSEIINLEHVGTKMPSKWSKLRSHLKSLEKHYITEEEYFNICISFNFKKDQALYISQFFHDLGVFLHFQNTSILSDIIFINPEWATNALYTIVYSKKVIKNNGRFQYSDLKKIWKEYPSSTHQYLIRLMEKFELVFPLQDSNDKFIVPELLSKEKFSIEWAKFNGSQHIFQYKFMPAGIITRLISRNHRYVYKNHYWRYGVIFYLGKALAIVTSNPYERVIKFSLNGELDEISKGRDLLSHIRNEIKYINQTLNNPLVEEKIPCNCASCLNSRQPHLFNFTTIVKFNNKGIKNVNCEKSAEEVNIKKLTNNYLITTDYSINKDIDTKFIEKKIIEIKTNNFDKSRTDKILNKTYIIVAIILAIVTAFVALYELWYKPKDANNKEDRIEKNIIIDNKTH